ncbi:MAG: endonuclease/exonuclease/phosphatase family protein [Patescibacteria group bacterium]
MNITCATYNILHGYHSDMILKNLRFLIDGGADIVCLQEAEPQFAGAIDTLLIEKNLSHWRVHHAHVGFGGNLAILWNTDRLDLVDTKIVRFHKLRVPSRLQRIRGFTDSIERAALIGTFMCGEKTIQVANAHIAWEGGMKHRMRQIQHLRETIEEDAADARIVAGDFNTVGLHALRHARERKVEQTLGKKYVNALPKLRWSFDIAYSDPRDKLRILASLYYLGVKFRNRLDYIFAAHLDVISATMHDLPGSDHRPLVATFSTDLSKRPNALS